MESNEGYGLFWNQLRIHLRSAIHNLQTIVTFGQCGSCHCSAEGHRSQSPDEDWDHHMSSYTSCQLIFHLLFQYYHNLFSYIKHHTIQTWPFNVGICLRYVFFMSQECSIFKF